VMKESPTTATAYALATAYLRIKQPEKSLPLAQAILEKEPGNVEVRLFHGRLLRDQKRYAEAARQFHMVAQAEPGRLEAWSELTAMLMLLGQYEPALEAIERVRTLGGETAAYHYLRATMLDATKQHKPALASYRRFLELSEGKNPDEEFKARQRVRLLQKAAER
jgi:tetratricopeptide (TPR) repeat protein